MSDASVRALITFFTWFPRTLQMLINISKSIIYIQIPGFTFVYHMKRCNFAGIITNSIKNGDIQCPAAGN